MELINEHKVMLGNTLDKYEEMRKKAEQVEVLRKRWNEAKDEVEQMERKISKELDGIPLVSALDKGELFVTSRKIKTYRIKKREYPGVNEKFVIIEVKLNYL
ncbi:hypothetical protein SAMN04515674_101502 [Pseudarcicella hirudinis]|uniref:Uncharacterized protein n=1 Tax=Pseudarcicella hirudinis TaxID=1079859 RepID=A0A1I5MYA6_9BACT|nr:hypothetical protein [Pseudarcicella hirudinis]SFP14367.1 hypothetical protein SAMN04515674_101502 [Pseudarcicella hirudinis]